MSFCSVSSRGLLYGFGGGVLTGFILFFLLQWNEWNDA
jgi:hypothetical protein